MTAPDRHGARVARFCLPGRMWYFAACHDCDWLALSWKDRGWAKNDAMLHNKARHPTSGVASIEAWMTRL